MDNIARTFMETAGAFDELEAPDMSGLYAVYLRSESALPKIATRADSLIYIGKSRNMADRMYRQHFATGCTSDSTLRRSLGAILKDELKLFALPSSKGCYNYKFIAAGERDLTMWMRRNLLIGFYPSDEYYELELDTIQTLQPPLNLTHWENPQAAALKALRAVCANEARAFKATQPKDR